MKKIFLIFIIATLTAIPAIADNITNNSMCVVGVLNQSNDDSTANINALWSADNYPCSTGQYLYVGSIATNDENTIECRTCPSGSYCGGGNYTVDNHANDILSCSTVGNGTFTLSPSGSSANTDCYKTCSTNCIQPSAPAHATNVTYGNETSNGVWNYNSSCNAVAPTCSINFDCVTGYHKRPDISREMFLEISGIAPDDYTQEEIDEQYNDFISELDSASPEEMLVMDNILPLFYGNPEIWQPFDSLISNFVSNPSSGLGRIITYSKSLNGTERCEENSTVKNCDEINNVELSNFRQTAQNGDWVNVFTDYDVSVAGTSMYNNDCKMKITEINGYNVTMNWLTESTDLDNVHVSYDNCANENARINGQLLVYVIGGLKTHHAEFMEGFNFSDDFFAADFHVEGDYTLPYICAANKINLEWYDVGDNVYETNQCTYNTAITLPSTDPTRPGYTFTGWRLRQ